MSYAISIHRLGHLRQTAVNDLSKVIQCLVAPRFKYRTLVVLAKQHNYSVIGAWKYDAQVDRSCLEKYRRKSMFNYQ
jgi:hypothetical protein